LSEAEIPANVRSFVHDHVESVVQVEVLLLLQAEPARAFSGADVVAALRVEPAWARAQLSDLAGRGMLAEAGPGAYRFAPRTAEMADAVAGLARAYADRRVTVIGMIYAKPSEPLRSFADAFRIRKDQGRQDG
jgi:predicted transcriptional regulator of viral defense system